MVSQDVCQMGWDGEGWWIRGKKNLLLVAVFTCFLTFSHKIKHVDWLMPSNKKQNAWKKEVIQAMWQKFWLKRLFSFGHIAS